MSSVDGTSLLDSLTGPDLADLWPRLEVVAPDAAWRLPAEAVVLDGRALVRVHVAVDPHDGRPLRRSSAPSARLVPVAAGTGPVAVTSAGVRGRLDATRARPAVAYRVDWAEVDDVGPARSGGVRLLSSARLGGLTLDILVNS